MLTLTLYLEHDTLKEAAYRISLKATVDPLAIWPTLAFET